MKRILFIIALIFLLAGCLDQKEIKDSMDDLKEKKIAAISAMNAQDFSIEGLLKIHNYFFNFAEKVNLMMSEEKATKMIQSFVDEYGVKNFCESFIISTSIWQRLEDHCSNGSFYKCSPEIKEYKNFLLKFKEIAGTTLNQKFNAESSCN